MDLIKLYFEKSEAGLLEKINKNDSFSFENNKIIQLPKYLKDYVYNTQCENWIKAFAHSMYAYSENKNYIQKEIGDHRSKIEIIDYKNTGVLLEGVNLSNGVHQFLQMKHGLELTNETLTS